MTSLDLMIPRIVEYHHILKNPSELGAALDRLAKANLQLLLGANAGRLYGVMGADAILQGFTRGVRDCSGALFDCTVLTTTSLLISTLLKGRWILTPLARTFALASRWPRNKWPTPANTFSRARNT